jgi:hypothetical protein
MILTSMAVHTATHAQNVQLHYDFGRYIYDYAPGERPLLTSTVEMFKIDPWGSTYLFTDMDHTSAGVASAYWEIAREITFRRSGPFSAHIEYNGGLNYIRNAYLAGATYTYNRADFKIGYSLSAMYKYIQKHSIEKYPGNSASVIEAPHNFQITATWYLHFAANNLCTLTGFADFWREKTANGNFILLSEPQFWLHLNRLKGLDEHFNLSLGSEIELSYNFAARNGLYIVPTAALRWDF